MRKSVVLQVSLLVMVVLGVNLRPVNGEVASLNWASPTTNALNSIFMVSANDGWAVGMDGTSIHWDGTQWSNVTNPYTGLTGFLSSVSMVSASDGWAVGLWYSVLEGWKAAFMHWNGTGWSTVATPIYVPASVDMVSASDGWVVGGNSIGRWNGVEWNYFTDVLDVTASLNSVFMVSASDGWAVEQHGAIIRWSGTGWSTVTSPTTNALYSVYMVSSSLGWAVGDAGTIIRWNGAQWSTVTSPTSNALYSVYMVSASDGWAVGNGGTIIRWNGAQWSLTTSPTTDALFSVFMVGPSDGWAVGDGGTIVQWTGTTWIPEFSTLTIMPLLISITLVVVILKKTSSKSVKAHNYPSKPRHSATAPHLPLISRYPTSQIS